MSSSEGYNLCIIGTGKVGGEIADRICRSSLNIENIFLFNKSVGKAESLKRVLERDKSNKSIHTIRSSAELEKRLGDIDISILSIGVEYHEDRMSELGSALPGVIELAEVHKQAKYCGNSIIITNPVDTVSYIWALYSGLPHQTIVGLGLLDTIRARDIIAEEITSRLGKYCEGVELGSEDINAFCIGPHSEKATPYILGIRGFKLKEKEAPWQIIFGESEEHYEQLRRAIDQRAKDTYRALGGTHKEVAQATEELLASLTQNSGELLSGSVFFRLRDHPDYKSDPEYANHVSRRDRGVFIGTVIKFENRLAVPQQIKLEGIVKKMFAEACMELEDVLDNLRQGTLKDLKGNPMRIKGYVKDSKAPKLEAKVSETVVIPGLRSDLEQQYETLVSRYQGEVIKGPGRVKRYSHDYDEWRWRSGTFPNIVSEVFKPDFESTGVGEMFGFVVYESRENPGKFFGIGFYKHSEDKLCSIRQTNDDEYARKYKDKFGIGG